MSHYPHGDASGPSDGYPGSLFGVGHSDQNYVSEFSIPAPVILTAEKLQRISEANYTNLDQYLNRAATLQSFSDVTEGRMHDYVALQDVQYMQKHGDQTTDKLYWSMWDYYVPSQEELLGWSELELSNPRSQGAWKLTVPSLATTSAQVRYMFEISRSWADQYTPGKYLAVGRSRGGQSQGSWGPALYAVARWNDGNPPPHGAALETVQLLYYPESQRVDASPSDGAWLDVGDKQSVVFAGAQAVGTYTNGLEYYGAPKPHYGEGAKGQHAEPYYENIIFYDVNDLAAVVQGTKKAWEPRPYAVFNVAQYMIKPGGVLQGLGGVGYDQAHQLLYIFEQGVGAVHVFRVTNGSGEFDTAAPTDPKNVHLASSTASQITIAWDPATDNTGVQGYLVYRDFNPIAFARAASSSFTDSMVSPNTNYTYTISAFDASNNYGAQSPPFRATTVNGTDSIVPDIIRGTVQVRDITATSAVIRWQTDEPSTTELGFNRIYHDDEHVIVRGDAGLRTFHTITLTGLQPGGFYTYSPVARDALGNSYEWKNSLAQFYTASTPPADNHAPGLNSVGARTIHEGERLEFTISGSDSDGQRVFYQADDLPEGAIFNRWVLYSGSNHAYFSWTPRFDQAGVYPVTFTVSDGTLSSSDTVVITVVDTGSGPTAYVLTATASPSAGGAVVKSPNQASHAPGTTVTLTATPNAGYTFTGWSGSLTGTTNPAAVTMNSSKAIAAVFTEISDTLAPSPPRVRRVVP